MFVLAHGVVGRSVLTGGGEWAATEVPFAEPVAVALEVDKFRVVDETVGHGCGHLIVA